MKDQGIFEFSEFRLDPRTRTLRRRGEAVTLNRRAYDLLLYLVQNPGRILPREELVKNIWPDTFVDDNSLAQSISALRRALEEKPGDNNYVVTVPGRGYQFVPEVKTTELAVSGMGPAEVAATGVAGVILERETIRTSITRQENGLPPLPAPRRARTTFVVAVLLLAVIAVGGYWLHLRSTHHLTAKDTVVLADFANHTGDAVFDDTLKTALGIALAESPFLNTLSDNKVRSTLRLMARPPDTKIEPAVAREICQRAGGKAYIAGSIAQLGSQYVLTLEAMNCQSGDTMAREQATAAAKEKVLDAIGQSAAKMRSELGESLATVQRFDVPLAQSTTPSFEALKAFTLGVKVLYRRDLASAPPYFEHALELDPNFAMAYVALGNTYMGLGERGRAREYFAKGFSLRDRTSELEKLAIAAEYYAYTTGELDKALQAMLQDLEYKPASVYLGLADVYARLGQYDKAADTARTLLARDADFTFAFVDLASDDIALQNFSGARQVIQQAKARAIHNYVLNIDLYTLSFLQSDSAGMAEQERWFEGQSVYAHYGLAMSADTEAYVGHLNKAREFTRLAADSAVRTDNKENAGMYRADAALREAAYGNPAEARKAAAEALELAPDSPDNVVLAALALGMTGETAQAESLVQDLRKHYPLDTQLQQLALPAIEAEMQFIRQPELALDSLRAGLPIEFANTDFSTASTSCLYPTYVRGQVYLAAGQGKAAAAEFQKIIDHSGLVGNCWTGALAHLGVGRANALESRMSHDADAAAARTRAVAAYKDFFNLWKDADAGIPILKQARAEYAKLQ